MTSWVLVIVAAPFALALVLFCLREPMRVALPVFAALVPFGGALAVGPSRYGSLSSLAGVVLGAGLVLQLITSRKFAPRLPSSVPVWLIFLGVAGATILWTINRPTTISGLAVLTSLVVVYTLTATSHVDRSVVTRVENGLLAGAVAVVGYGLYQLLVEGGFPSETSGGPVAEGRFGNGLLGPGVEAVSLLLPLAIALSRTFSRGSTGSRLLHAGIAALTVFGIFMTGSRTGTLATGLVLVTLTLASPRRARKGLAAALFVGVVAASVIWIVHPAGIADRTFETVSASSGRTDIWQVAFAACSDYCGYGSGWGTFPEVYAATQATVPGARVLAGAGNYQPHNLWVLAAIELGIPGLVLLILGLARGVLDAVRLPVRLRGAPLSALVGLIFSVFFLSSMEFKFFWMVLMMVAIYGNLAAAEAQEEELPEEQLV